MSERSTHRVRQRHPRGHKSYAHTGDWNKLDASELDALPVGVRRTIILDGVWLTMQRKDGGWTISQRHRVPSMSLGGHWSVATAPHPPQDQ